MKRSGVKELVNALVSNGVSIEDVVIERDHDGSVRVFKRHKKLKSKLSPLEQWRRTHAAAS